ncbi:hypothetical protein [Tatumella sp. UCD-D_suzukii]|uniref:hypothetical protein n=1 Tax=Tatumella sp. UCD-D_suzukii TaxID=1408192 RepID=UPI0004723D38|nr:hypothetical protein [Tatumella sp. UCD-D_suzukii]
MKQSELLDGVVNPYSDIVWLCVITLIIALVGVLFLYGRDALPKILTVFAIGGILFLFASMTGDYVDEQQQWKSWADQHCKIVEKRDGQNTTGVGLGLNGKVGVFAGSTESQTAYRCDDGVTYWKNY